MNFPDSTVLPGPQLLLQCAIPFLTSAWRRAGYNNLTQAFYNRQKREQESMQRMFRTYWGKREPQDGPVGIGITFVVPMPKSWSIKKKKEFYGTQCISKPDIDNLAKFLLDAMNGIIFFDDRQCYLSNKGIAKYWGYHGRTFIWIEQEARTCDIESIERLFPETVRRHLDNVHDLIEPDEETCEGMTP